MEIPVIIAHFNTAPSYLKHALSSAARFNQHVILIGDSSNQSMWKNHCDETEIPSAKFLEFLKSHVILSDYREDYAISVWKRMFLIEEWMKTNKADKAILLDSDIVTFMNYSKEWYHQLPEGTAAALIIPKNQENYNWYASPHFSYWTLEGIEDFTNFSIDTYAGSNNLLPQLKAKYQWHLDNSIAGGVCEMTLLYLWSQQTHKKVFNAAQASNGITADCFINTPTNYFDDEYLMRYKVKHFTFKGGLPFGYNKVLNQEIQFCCIHCQASAKPAMAFLANRMLQRFYFLGKLYGDLRVELGVWKSKIKGRKLK